MGILRKLAWLAGGVGTLLCALGVGTRAAGLFWLAGFQAGTLLLAGIAGLTFGCFLLLTCLTLKD